MIWLSLVSFFGDCGGGRGRCPLDGMRGHASVYGNAMPQRFHLGDVPRMGGCRVVGHGP